MKSFLIGVLVLGLSVPGAFAMPVPLSDVDGHQYASAIEYLYIHKIISGYDDGTFKPDKTINRAELLKILVGGAGFGKPDVTKYHDCFPDVKSDWYASYVCFAKEKGWVDGYDDGLFRPDQNIKKVEAIKMLMNSQGFPPALNAFAKTSMYTDVDLKEWYGQYMFPAEAMKILDIAGTKYGPAAFITRGEISNNIYRAMLIISQKVGSFDQVDMNMANEGISPSAPTVSVAAQTFSDITLAVKLPTYTGDSTLDSVWESFTNPNNGMGESGSMNIELNKIVGTWTTTFHVQPKLENAQQPVYEFTFWVSNKNKNASEKVTIKVSGLSANPERPTVSATLVTKNSIEFKIDPPAYTGSSALTKYSYKASTEGGDYSKDFFENTMHNKFSIGALAPNTTYTVTFWVVNADGKQSDKITQTVTTSAN